MAAVTLRNLRHPLATKYNSLLISLIVALGPLNESESPRQSPFLSDI